MKLTLSKLCNNFDASFALSLLTNCLPHYWINLKHMQQKSEVVKNLQFWNHVSNEFRFPRKSTGGHNTFLEWVEVVWESYWKRIYHILQWIEFCFNILCHGKFFVFHGIACICCTKSCRWSGLNFEDRHKYISVIDVGVIKPLKDLIKYCFEWFMKVCDVGRKRGSTHATPNIRQSVS